VSALVALLIGTVQIAQFAVGAGVWLFQKINGPPPLNLPLRNIHAGMLHELEYNIDCLRSYEHYRYDVRPFDNCKPITRYTDTWFSHLAVVSARDDHSLSENTLEDWQVAKRYYKTLFEVDDKASFLKLESTSPVTLRDALFLTGYIRFYYKNYYQRPLPKHCLPIEPMPPECRPDYNRLYGEMEAWQEQIDSWAGPSRYTVRDGRPVETYVDWLGYHD
jgi:hypothetical protein